jgi:hypothetical protein
MDMTDNSFSWSHAPAAFFGLPCDAEIANEKLISISRLINSALTSANLLLELFPALAVLLFAQELSLLAGLPAPQVLLQDEHAGSNLPPRLIESRLGQPATNARLHHHNFLELQQKNSKKVRLREFGVM